MGYEIKRIIRLDFEEADGSDGAFVRFRSIPFGTYAEMVEDGSISKTAEVFAGALVEWNLEFDGEPLPLTVESVNQLDPALRDLILVEFMRALRGGSANHPLVLKSNEPAPVPSMSMDDL